MFNNNDGYRCPNCGEINSGDSHFCSACGTRLMNFETNATLYMPNSQPQTDPDSEESLNLETTVTEEEVAIEEYTSNLSTDSSDSTQTVEDELIAEKVPVDSETPAVDYESVAEDEPKAQDMSIPTLAHTAEKEDMTAEKDEPASVSLAYTQLSDFSSLSNSSFDSADIQAQIVQENITEADEENAEESLDDEILEESAPNAEVVEENVKPTYRHPLFDTVKKHIAAVVIIPLILSLLLLVPFVKVKTAYNDYTEYSVSISPVDFAVLGFNSFNSYSSSQIRLHSDYQLYSKLKNNVEKYSSNSRLTNTQVDNLEKFAEKAMTIHLSKSSTPTKANLLAAFVFTVMLAAILLITLLLAALMLIFYSAGFHNAMSKLLSFISKTVVFLLGFIPVYVFVLMQAGHLTYGSDIKNFGDRGVSLAFGGIAALAMVSIVMIYVGCKYVASIIGKETSAVDFAQKTRIAAVICLAVAMIAILTPCITVGAAARSGMRSYNETFAVWPQSFYELSEEDISHLRSEIYMTSDEDIADIVSGVVLRGKAVSQFGARIFNLVAFIYGKSMKSVYLLAAIFHIMSIALLSIFIVRATTLLISKKSIKRQKMLIWLSALSTLAYLVTCVVAVIACNVNMSRYLSSYILVSIGIGPVVAVLCTVAAAVLLSIHCKKKAPCEYDNPDVSYAPYVVK